MRVKVRDILKKVVIKIIVGIPRGLMFCKYYPFIQVFLKALDVQIITSEETNKKILDLGVKYCVDDACFPMKIFHGHVGSIKDQCDLIIIPRIMKMKDGKCPCPNFGGLPEMIYNNIPNMPKMISKPIYLNSDKKIWKWVKELGKELGKNHKEITRAYIEAKKAGDNHLTGIKNDGYKMNVLLLGHVYNLYDSFSNMNIVKKLNKLGVGVVTEEFLDDNEKEKYADNLFKRPFWYIVKDTFGASMDVYNNKTVDGIIYLSSFACNVDSVVAELIRGNIENFPLLVLKLDEQTGDAGLNTRIEAFVDMIERKCEVESNFSTLRQHTYCS